MKKILIVSDTHGRDDVLKQVLQLEMPIDLLIHAGDSEGSETYYPSLAMCPVRCVAGNNDFFSQSPSDDMFALGEHRVFLTHGHHYYVSTSHDYVLDEAASREADVLIFGHTHRPFCQEENGILVLNPGSLAYPRQADHRPTYIILNLGDDGSLTPVLKYVSSARERA